MLIPPGFPCCVGFWAVLTLPLVEGLLSSGAASPAPASGVYLKHVSPFYSASGASLKGHDGGRGLM